MKQLPDHPVIRSIEKSGYPPWMQEPSWMQEEDSAEEDCEERNM